MQLHHIARPHNVKHEKTRVGRGGKRGTTSGRGTKGQRSRSGHRIRPAERDLIQRLPKLRGYDNKPTRIVEAIPLNRLKKLGGTKEVNTETLTKAGIIKFKSGMVIKLIGKDVITQAFHVKGLKTSASAKKAIETAGGKVE